MVLPTNVASTYPDDPDHPDRKLHQQHHDIIHAKVNEFADSSPEDFEVPDGERVPAGGTTSQVLVKASNTDFDTTWATPSGGGGNPVAGRMYAYENSGSTLPVVGSVNALTYVDTLDSPFTAPNGLFELDMVTHKLHILENCIMNFSLSFPGWTVTTPSADAFINFSWYIDPSRFLLSVGYNLIANPTYNQEISAPPTLPMTAFHAGEVLTLYASKRGTVGSLSLTYVDFVVNAIATA